MTAGSIRRAGFLAAMGLAAAAVCLLPGSAWATTITVSTAATLQNTLSPTCNSGISPCAHAGDTVSLAAGTYTLTQTLDVTFNVTVTGPSSAPGAILDGHSIVPVAPNNDHAILLNEAGTNLTVANLTFTLSSDLDDALVGIGTLNVQNSTFTGNKGDAIYVGGTSTITNSTIAGNGTTATTNDPFGGAGITVAGALTLQNDTISGNGSHGIDNGLIGVPTAIDNTIVYGNDTVDADRQCAMPASSTVGSLDGDGSCAVALPSTNPQLGPLASNGGPTQTEALARLSPAVGAGAQTGCPALDQRFLPRNDGSCDIGAYEFQDTSIPTLTVPTGGITVRAPDPSGAVVDYSAQVSASDPAGDPVTLSCTPPAGSTFPVGSTTVSCTATDNHNHSVSGSFVVHVTPPGGVNCNADGKIGGRGSTLFATLDGVLATGFQNDVCGAVSDTSGTTMSVFNSGGLGGETIGLEAASCRSDAFAGVDAPYLRADLTQLKGAPGLYGCGDLAAASSPYQPTPGPYPDPTDATANLMTFPVAGTAVAIGVDLQAADCGGTAPPSLQLSTTMVSRLLSGDIKNWNDPYLRTGGLNPELAGCNVPVVRVVRLDSSTTTTTLKNYLVRGDNARASATSCSTGAPWTWYSDPSQNANWFNDEPNHVVCSQLLKPSQTGQAAQLSLCASTHGAICYADLPAMAGQPTLIEPALQNATATSYAPPTTVSGGANCNLGSVQAPIPGTSGAVGLGSSDTWATDNPSGNHGNVTFTGPAYPICELTYALVYTGLLNGNGKAIARLGSDQRRTLASFFIYVLSSAGQSKLSSAGFAPLPSSLLDQLRPGLQANL
jgi:ABC-type phosphate transport system substrate-binding protein